MPKTVNTREERENHISDLCDQCGCKEKIRRIHFELYVDKQWHPHPPQAFVEWWNTVYPDAKKDLVASYNSEHYQNEWHEAKHFGAI